jgi:hypothetical protein
MTLAKRPGAKTFIALMEEKIIDGEYSVYLKLLSQI